MAVKFRFSIPVCDQFIISNWNFEIKHHLDQTKSRFWGLISTLWHFAVKFWFLIPLCDQLYIFNWNFEVKSPWCVTISILNETLLSNSDFQLLCAINSSFPIVILKSNTILRSNHDFEAKSRLWRALYCQILIFNSSVRWILHFLLGFWSQISMSNLNLDVKYSLLSNFDFCCRSAIISSFPIGIVKSNLHLNGTLLSNCSF